MHFCRSCSLLAWPKSSSTPSYSTMSKTQWALKQAFNWNLFLLVNPDEAAFMRKTSTKIIHKPGKTLHTQLSEATHISCSWAFHSHFQLAANIRNGTSGYIKDFFWAGLQVCGNFKSFEIRKFFFPPQIWSLLFPTEITTHHPLLRKHKDTAVQGLYFMNKGTGVHNKKGHIAAEMVI